MNGGKESRILSFKNKAPAADEAHANSLKVLYSTGKPKAPNAAKTRQISTKPERILDAPDLRDDFYLHLLDWSKNNHMAVALHDTLFVWNAADGSIEEMYRYVSIVSLEGAGIDPGTNKKVNKPKFKI
jgi:cell division cycle protein 20 (cofactor of APC complex)